jgi:hypothetical protein
MPVADVIVPVVGDAQIPPPRPLPVGDQHRQRAIARLQPDRRDISAPACLQVGAVQFVRVAGHERPGGVGAVDIVADGERRPLRPRLPRRGKGGGPRVAAMKAPVCAGILEPAIAQAPQQQVRPDPQHRQVHHPVAVHVQRIGPGDAGDRLDLAQGEPDGSARRLGRVHQQPRRVLAPRHEQRRPPRPVAVQRRHAAAHEMLPPAGVFMRHRQVARPVDEGRIGPRQSGRGGHERGQKWFRPG